MKKHVRVLEDAGLVTHREGRAGAPLQRSARAVSRTSRTGSEHYRRMLDERLDRFGELLERNEGDSR